MPSVPGVLNYPTALDDADSLIRSANAATTTLTAGYAAGASTLTVASNALFPTSGLLTLLPSLLILRYTGKSSTTGFTGVARASSEPNNPADQNVASGSTVEQRITSNSLDVLRSAVLALEAKLGFAADTPTGGDFLRGATPGMSLWAPLDSGAVTTALGFTPGPNLGFTPLNEHGLTVVADDQAGADLGAKINAADALLGANAGTIRVIQPGTISTAVSISANHVLQFGPGTFTQSAAITLNGTASALVGTGARTTTINNSSTTAKSVILTAGISNPLIANLSLVRTASPTATADGISQAGILDGALISNVWVEAHHYGMALGPVGLARIENCTITLCTSDGILFLNTAGSGTLQWTLRDVALSVNAGNGIQVFTVAGPAGISMGSWTRIFTFANNGNGIKLLGTAGVPIAGFRLSDSFLGQDGDSEIYLDTYGGGHQIEQCFCEAAGTIATGPGFATGATNVGRGIYATTNNTYVQIIGNTIINNSYNGMFIQATNALLQGNTCINNGLATVGGERSGIRANCSGSATIVGNDCYNLGGGTTQIFGIYTDLDTVTIVGNSVQGSTQALGFTSGPIASYVSGNRVLSGTAGVASSIADSLSIGGGTLNGQKLNVLALTELTTIAAAATTDTAIQIPAGAIVLGVSVRVTTVIPTAATFTVGIAGATTRYGTGISVAANTTYPGTDDGTRFYAAATAIRITPNLPPGANTGRVRVTIHYITITPPTS